MIDLRSDTVTRPTPAMREFMAKAEVGDDGYGDDPTVNLLQEKSARVTGKEDALFLPSGTMANVVAIMCHTRPSDSVILGKNAHSWLYESGSIGAVAGVLPIIVGEDGTFTWEDVNANAKGGDVHMAPTTLVMMENTHNGGGGIVFPQKWIVEICEKAGFWGIKTHIDGARIFNASIASGKPAAELCAPVDSVSFCLSKGLGAPVGSMLCGTRDFILKARRYRELLGGGMRQVGIVAAGGVWALDNHVERLEEDHANAMVLARGLKDIKGLRVDLERVHTNMVFIGLEKDGLNAFEYAARLGELGVKINAMGKDFLRAVTHLDVSWSDVTRAIDLFEKALA